MPTKKKLKPKFVIHADRATYLLGKRPHQRHHYVPFTPEQQSQFLSSDQTANESTLWNKMSADLNHQQKKGTKRKAKNTSKKKFRHACRTLFDAPNMLPDPKPGWMVLLLSLLASVLDLFLPDLPSAPTVRLRDSISIPEPLESLLRAVHGPSSIKGKKTRVKRPACIRAFVPKKSLAPSLDLEDYIGGYTKVHSFKRHFWFPLRCTAFALAASVPQPVQATIIDRSPLTIPIVCSPTLKLKDRPLELQLDGPSFDTVDGERLKQLRKRRGRTYLVVNCFAHWLRHSKKQRKKVREDISKFYPRAQNGGMTTTTAPDDVKALALALAIFKRFLRYASKQDWLTHEEAQAILTSAWTCLLPASAPAVSSGANAAAGSWNDPGIFWSFLEHYLQANQQRISLTPPPCAPDVVAVTHTFSKTKFLILPRSQFTHAYFTELQARGIAVPSDDEKKGGVAVQRMLLNWGVQVKKEGEEHTWRYTFYDKQTPKNDRKLPCLAFPISQLPDSIISRLSDWFGAEFDPWIPSSAARNIPDPEKVTENAENGANYVS